MRPATRFRRSEAWRPFGLAVAFVALVAFIGCGDDDKNPAKPGSGGTPTTSGFTGFMTDGKQSGKATLTVNSVTLAGRLPAHRAGAAEVAASATFTLDGMTATISGVYSEEGDTLNLSGSGYAIRAELDSGGDSPGMVGTYDGPSGPGFFGTLTNALLPMVYCGNFWNTAMDDSGTFNIVANDTAFAAVVLAAVDPELGSVSGQVSGTGTTRTLSGMEGDTSTAVFSVSGTLNVTTGEISGTWTYTSYDVPMYGTSDDGTFQATLCP